MLARSCSPTKCSPSHAPPQRAFHKFPQTLGKCASGFSSRSAVANLLLPVHRFQLQRGVRAGAPKQRAPTCPSTPAGRVRSVGALSSAWLTLANRPYRRLAAPPTPLLPPFPATLRHSGPLPSGMSAVVTVQVRAWQLSGPDSGLHVPPVASSSPAIDHPWK